MIVQCIAYLFDIACMAQPKSANLTSSPTVNIMFSKRTEEKIEKKIVGRRSTSFFTSYLVLNLCESHCSSGSNAKHSLLDKCIWQHDDHQIGPSALASNVYTILLPMQFPVPSKFVDRHGTMCTIVKCLDVCVESRNYSIFAPTIYGRLIYFRCDCISISLRTCFSTRPPVSSDLNITFIATINLVRFSRARYTRPNLPRPRDAPSSKSSLLHSYL